MSPEVAEPREEVRQEPVTPPAPALRPAPGLLRRGFFFVWKYFVACILALNPLTSVLIVGWTYRAVQRCALGAWWRRSPQRTDRIPLRQCLAGRAELEPHGHWPNWILGQSPIRERAPGEARRRGIFRTCLGSLGLNLKLGVQGVFNTYVLTLPACALWLFAWFAGWNNSFHKGYELAWVGPTTGILGILLFLVAMLYVPFAQARQSVSGSWRAFWDYRLIRRLMRTQWSQSVVLAIAYSFLSIPLMTLMAAPMFFPQIAPSLEELTDAEALAFLQRYYFWVAVYGFAAFFFLRWLAARFYAAALLGAVRAGNVSADELTAFERQAFESLRLLREFPRSKPHPVVRFLGWTGNRLARVTSTVILLLIWFTFVAQIFVKEFLHYHHAAGWLHQALVQLPWFSYIPDHLREAAGG